MPYTVFSKRFNLFQGSIINKDDGSKGSAQGRKDFRSVQGIIRKSSLGNFFFKGDEKDKEMAAAEKETTITEESQDGAKAKPG